MRRSTTVLAVLAMVSGGAVAGAVSQTQTQDDLSRRATQRLAILQRESDALATQERTLLVELRKLELDRQIKAAKLAEVDRESAQVQAQLADAETRASTLATQVETERPDIEARFVQMYKLGRFGYWRMLLDVNSLREVAVKRDALILEEREKDAAKAAAKAEAAEAPALPAAE